MKIQGLILLTILGFTNVVIAEPKMPGSYSGVSITDDRVIDAANFAVEKINNGKLVQIISAHQQVVAGMNYDLILQIKTKGGKLRTYEVRVFMPLPVTEKPMQLKSVVELDD
jgi:hypothetical protein